MRSWVTDLLAAWRGERIVLSSPLPIEAARRWLSDSSAPGTGDVIRRSAAKVNTRNTWRPVVEGRLFPAGSGCMFVGVLGWDPVLKGLTCCLFAPFALSFLIGAGVTAVSAALGDWHMARSGLGTFGLGLFGMAVALTSTVVGYRETRGQTAYLRSWITGGMNAPWYRGRQNADD